MKLYNLKNSELANCLYVKKSLLVEMESQPKLENKVIKFCVDFFSKIKDRSEPSIYVMKTKEENLIFTVMFRIPIYNNFKLIKWDWNAVEYIVTI